MNTDFNQFFSQFQSQESIAILVFLIIAFLLGLFAGRLSKRGKIKRLERELEEKKKELADAQAESAGLREQLDLKDADLRKADFDLREREDKIARLEAEKATYYHEISKLNTELEKLQAANHTYTATISDLNDQIMGLKAKNQQIVQQLENEDDSVNDLAQIQSIYNATRNRLEAMENKLDRLANENQSLRTELDEIRESRPVDDTAARGMEPLAAPPPPVEETPEEILDLTRDKTVMGEKIIIDGSDRDDFTRIDGLGPFLAKKLNETGVFKFEDIAAWDEDRIAEVTEQIGYIPGRIRQDDWVGQAQKLARQKEENPEAFKPVTDAPADREDLKVVEGIGPKIEQLLKDAGITDWDQLAESEADHLRDILATAGDHYRVHDPSTWPAQARLAANGNWELLHEYQEQLKGGRETK